VRILLTCLEDSRRCPRLLRLIPFLGNHELVVVDTVSSVRWSVEPRSPFWKFCSVALTWLGIGDAFSRKRINMNLPIKGNFDLVICFDVLLLPNIFSMSEFSKIMLDAREFYPRQFENSLSWRLGWGQRYHVICKRYLSRLSMMTTVSRGLADAYSQSYGVNPVLIHSYPVNHDLVPTITSTPIRLVHHGTANRNRSIENMIAMMPNLSGRFSLDLYLTGSDREYIDELRSAAANFPNVHIRREVPYEKIVSMLNNYDIGLFVPPPSTLNLKHAMPNKLFEFVQARLMIVVSNLDDAAEFVKHHGVGVSANTNSAEGLALELGKITVARVDECKRASDLIAPSMTAATFAEEFQEVIDQAVRNTCDSPS